MRCEIPILLRCCCCFPLRYGLLVWAYVKQIISVVYLIFIILNFRADLRRMGLLAKVTYPVFIILTLVDVVFHVLFIISAHRKDYKKMRIFYRYSIVSLFIEIIMICMFVALCGYYVYLSPFMIIFVWYLAIPAFLMSVLVLVAQVYMIILVKSEFVKLKNNAQFEFVNQAADEKCTASIDFVEGFPDSV